MELSSLQIRNFSRWQKLNFVGYIVDFLISCFLQKSLEISNFKEKFDRFFHESYNNSRGLWQS